MKGIAFLELKLWYKNEVIRWCGTIIKAGSYIKGIEEPISKFSRLHLRTFNQWSIIKNLEGLSGGGKASSSNGGGKTC